MCEILESFSIIDWKNKEEAAKRKNRFSLSLLSLASHQAYEQMIHAQLIKQLQFTNERKTEKKLDYPFFVAPIIRSIAVKEAMLWF